MNFNSRKIPTFSLLLSVAPMDEAGRLIRSWSLQQSPWPISGGASHEKLRFNVECIVHMIIH